MYESDSLISIDLIDLKARQMDDLNEQIVGYDHNRLEHQFVEAQLLMHNGSYFEASKQFETLIQFNYKIDDCHQLCGFCDFMIDHYWLAYCHFNKTYIKLYEYMIECLFGMKQYDKAAQLISEIDYPTDRSFYLKSKLLFYQNKHYNSLLAIQQAIAMNPIPLYMDFQEKINIQYLQLKLDTLNLQGK